MAFGYQLAKYLLPFVAFICCAAQRLPLPPQDSQVPNFQSTTRLVVLDVVVTDDQGNPVRNLSKEDFSILEDGAGQTIASFESPDDHAPVNAETRPASAEISAGAEEKIRAQPLTILVFDALDTKILDQAHARYEIKKFLEAHGPQLTQPTALMALEEKRLELLHDYTRDAKQLETALDAHKAQLPFRLMKGMGFSSAYAATDRFEASERFGDAILALREIAASNTQFAGRKNLIWIGPGFPSFDHLNVRATDRVRLQTWGRETMDLITQARLAVYTIDPRGLEVFPEEIMTPTTNELAFESIAPLSGGRIFRGLNDVDAQIASSIADGAAYYAISYYPSNHDWNGRFRGVRVLLRNPNLTARTRAGYFAYASTAPTYKQLDTVLSQAVINPLPYHALAVQADARLSGSETRTAHMHVTLDAAGLHWEDLPEEKHRCEISLVAAAFSAKGDVVSHAAQEFEIVIDQKKFATVMKDGMVMNLSMRVPGNAVRMRVVARDSTNGNMGTADLTPEGEQFH
jgi:VWFA-related protein